MLHWALGDRLMFDYGDLMGYETPETHEFREQRRKALWERRRELDRNYDVIHGHFIADKYFGMFPDPRYICFVRDPYQQAISRYEYLQRNPQIEHPMVRIFHEQQLALLDFISWDLNENPQTLQIGSLTLGDFAMVGISEQFPLSVRLFEHLFAINLGPERFENQNPSREPYAITTEVRRAIDKHCERDIEFYRRARERFHHDVRDAELAATELFESA